MNRRSYLGEKNPNWKGGNTKVCLWCGENFIDVNYDSKRKYCGRKCYGNHRKDNNKAILICASCKILFTIYRHDINKRKYCSIKCAVNDPDYIKRRSKKRKGKKMTKEQREKLSILASKRKSGYSYGKNGHYNSSKAGELFYRSSYEKRAFELLDAYSKVVTYEAEPFSVPYMDLNGDKRRYLPDLLVHWKDGSKTLVEVKPAWKIDDPKHLVKSTYALNYARNHNMNFEVWTEIELGLVEHVGSVRLVNIEKQHSSTKEVEYFKEYPVIRKVLSDALP